MAALPNIPMSAEASDLMARLTPRIASRLEEVNRTPVSVLLWGPGVSSPSPLASCRSALRTVLRQRGHAAVFSEEICDPCACFSIRLQQLAQAQEFDLVVSLPCTPGSISEIHDFSCDRRVNAKTLVFINEEHTDGYGPKSLKALSTVLSCRIEYYPNEHDTGLIESVTYDEVQKIREMKYILAGRY